MAVQAPFRLRQFVMLRPEVEAVLQHVGLRTWDLLLVDLAGNWIRDEFSSPEHAEAVCLDLGIRLHRGWDDVRLVRRMNGRDHWSDPRGQRRAL